MCECLWRTFLSSFFVWGGSQKREPGFSFLTQLWPLFRRNLETFQKCQLTDSTWHRFSPGAAFLNDTPWTPTRKGTDDRAVALLGAPKASSFWPLVCAHLSFGSWHRFIAIDTNVALTSEWWALTLDSAPSLSIASLHHPNSWTRP